MENCQVFSTQKIFKFLLKMHYPKSRNCYQSHQLHKQQALKHQWGGQEGRRRRQEIGKESITGAIGGIHA